jgi:aryl sulfotransferase
MPISFINKGVTGRWADVLTAEESSHYEQIAVSQLGPECAQWLATGEITAH